MTNLENEQNKSDFSDLPDGSASFKHQVESALQQTDLRVERSVSLIEGTKVPQGSETGHTNPDNHRRPTSIKGNCSLHMGEGLAAIDIDDHQAFPDGIWSLLPDTLTIQTPHGGEHHLYHIPDDTGIANADLTNKSGHFQYAGRYIVCPGSTIHHSNCDSNKPNCSGRGTDSYQITNDPPIATLTPADNPELIDWMRNLGNNQKSTSGSTSTTSNTQQELDPLDQDQAQEQFDRIWSVLCETVEKAGRQILLDVLAGDEEHYVISDDDSIDLIEKSDNGSIDRSHADYYALCHLYGCFKYLDDSESEARENTKTVFRYFIQREEYHSDEQPRKLNTVNNQRQYLEKTMDSVEKNFDIGKWLRWANLKHFPDGGPDRFTLDSDLGDLHYPNKRSRLCKATVLAAIEWLTSCNGEQTVPIDDLQWEYRLDLEQVDVEQLPSIPSSIPKPPISCISVHPPHQSLSHSNQVHTGSVGEEEYEKIADRVYPTATEIMELAHQLNPERTMDTYRNTLSEMVNDPDPLRNVVQAKCPSRSNGERYVYYLDRESDGERDPADAECVKLHGRELEPETREPIVDGESTHEEEI